MILKFTRDYIGRETAMQQYKAGDSADFPNSQALELVRLGVAREIWASIGALYDPPKAQEPASVEVKEEPVEPKKKPRRKAKEAN